LLTILLCVVFAILQLKNSSSHSHNTKGNSFCFSYENSSNWGDMPCRLCFDVHRNLRRLWSLRVQSWRQSRAIVRLSSYRLSFTRSWEMVCSCTLLCL